MPGRFTKRRGGPHKPAAPQEEPYLLDRRKTGDHLVDCIRRAQLADENALERREDGALRPPSKPREAGLRNAKAKRIGRRLVERIAGDSLVLSRDGGGR